MYADDVVLIAENEGKLQKQINILKDWCMNWKLNVNLSKSQVVHFRKTRQKLTEFKFKFGNNLLAELLGM